MRLDTPVELHKLNDRNVYVKRDDLMGDGNILPPWGKMAGIDKLLENLDPKIPLIHLAVNGSWSGWALSYLCKQRGIKFIYAYPPSKTYNKFILEKAAKYDCDFKELTPNMMAILYNRIGSASEDSKTSFEKIENLKWDSKSPLFNEIDDSVYKKTIADQGVISDTPLDIYGSELNFKYKDLKSIKYKKMVVKDSFLKEYGDVQMLPYAFDHKDYRAILKQRADEVFKEHLVDHLVISAGSGVTSSPIIQAFSPGHDLFSNSQKRAHSITVSNVKTIYEKYKSHSMSSSAIEVYKTEFEFDDMMTDYEIPFPCNGTWDRKAWWWLENNIESLKGDILFWNIGGNI